ncbi:hypothetical protein [Lacihabitans lacunae]|uniref:50S ribosomal protein L32 n=1 Tax=Lacihabitans lacunae TaxID=1028214 RepID=A0ABV7YWA6_9BACT
MTTPGTINYEVVVVTRKPKPNERSRKRHASKRNNWHASKNK